MPDDARPSGLCSLHEKDFEGRERAWHAILSDRAARCRELPDGFEVRLRDQVGLVNELQQLISLENECCGWMNITLMSSSDIVVRFTTERSDGKDVIGLLIPAELREAAKFFGEV